MEDVILSISVGEHDLADGLTCDTIESAKQILDLAAALAKALDLPLAFKLESEA